MIHRTIDLVRLINNKIGIRSLKFSHMLDIKMKVIYYLKVYKCLLEKRFMIKVQISLYTFVRKKHLNNF